MGRVCICCTRKLDTFRKAYKFQANNSFVMAAYVITVPIANVIEYILQETDFYIESRRNLVVITRVYIMVFAIVSIIYMQSFAQSFQGILPFISFKRKLISVLLLQGCFNISGSIVRVTEAKVGPYSEYDSYKLLFGCVYSVILAVFALIQLLTLSPDKIKTNEERPLVLPLLDDGLLEKAGGSSDKPRESSIIQSAGENSTD